MAPSGGSRGRGLLRGLKAHAHQCLEPLVTCPRVPLRPLSPSEVTKPTLPAIAPPSLARFRDFRPPHHQQFTALHRTISRPVCSGDSILFDATSLPPRIFCRGISSGPASWPTQHSPRHSRQRPQLLHLTGRYLRIALIPPQTRCLLMATLLPWVKMAPPTLTTESRSWMRTRISSTSRAHNQAPSQYRY